MFLSFSLSLSLSHGVGLYVLDRTDHWPICHVMTQAAQSPNFSLSNRGLGKEELNAGRFRRKHCKTIGNLIIL